MTIPRDTLLLGAFVAGAFLLRRPRPAVGRMEAFRRVRVYEQPGKSGLSWTRGRSGVYVIFENRRRVYIGHSTTNLYRTITRHFQNWDDPTQRRVTYAGKIGSNTYHVAVIFTTPKQAESLERSLIIKHRPRDNDEKYAAYTADNYDAQTAERYDDVRQDPMPPPDDDYSDLPF